MDEWLMVYRSYSDSDLEAEITWLKTQVRNPFLTQTEGGRGVSRSTAEFRTRLAAAVMVQNERSSTDPRHGEPDFSGVQP